MADVTYNTSSFPALLSTLSSLLTLPSTSDAHSTSSDAPPKRPWVVLAYKERDPAERELWDMLTQKTGVVLQKIGAVPGAGAMEVEIWAGRALD